MKGASFDRGKWNSSCCVSGKKVYLGRFDTEEEAHNAYLEVAKIRPPKNNDIYDALEKLIICEPSTLDTGCWEYSGTIDSCGYGRISMNNEPQYIHRIVYTHFKGEIPEGLTLDHLCRNRKCANPEHLEIVPRGENVLRGDGISAKNARKTECFRGHPYNEENTYINTETGSRQCRECRRIYGEQYRNKKRAENGLR